MSVFFLLRAIIKYFSLWLIQLGYSPIVIPVLIGDPLSSPLHIELFLSTFIFIWTWLLSTKVKVYQKLNMRILVLFVMIAGIMSQLLWHSSMPIVRSLIPFLYMKKETIYIENYSLEEALLGNTDNIMLLLLALPFVFLFTSCIWLMKFCEQHWNDMMKQFQVWEYKLRIPGLVTLFMSDEKKRKASSELRQFFNSEKQKSIPLPDIELGQNTKSGEMVVLPGKDRTLNNLIIGSIGTGKTSALILPMINQDLHHMTNMINQFKSLYQKGEEYHTEDIKGSLFNGISVIEPSKDLCDKTYALVKAHGIPEEAIFYIDPTNPDTPSLNLFNAPVEKVAEMFTMVIEGIGESQEFFFQQSQRAHLKMHIYLLMLHAPEKKVGLDDLINMYKDAQLVASMHKELKTTIPEDIESIENRDEKNHWRIVQGVDEWFNDTYSPEMIGFGPNARPSRITEGKYKGQVKVEDKKSEHVVGLRNILNDIGSNILLRRVLFDKSDFDFDKHLEYGGILLVNTAKGELSKLSDVLGKFVLLSLQNAVFRRKPNISPYHSIYVDEFPDYINEDFKSFPAQSRKYKAIVTVVAQTTSQLSLKYGDDFMQTLISTLRNKFLYGDTTQHDAEMFSSIFGEKIVFEEGESDQEISPLMESPMRRTGLSYRGTQKSILSPSDLIFQDAFVCAVKIVENNKPLPAQQILANFVSNEEFKDAVVKVKEDAANYWLEIRKAQLNSVDGQASELLTQELELEEATEEGEFVMPAPAIEYPLSEVQYSKAKNRTVSVPSSLKEEGELKERCIIDQSAIGGSLKEKEPENNSTHSQSNNVPSDFPDAEQQSLSQTDTLPEYVSAEDEREHTVTPTIIEEEVAELSEYDPLSIIDNFIDQQKCTSKPFDDTNRDESEKQKVSKPVIKEVDEAELKSISEAVSNDIHDSLKKGWQSALLGGKDVTLPSNNEEKTNEQAAPIPESNRQNTNEKPAIKSVDDMINELAQVRDEFPIDNIVHPDQASRFSMFDKNSSVARDAMKIKKSVSTEEKENN